MADVEKTISENPATKDDDEAEAPAVGAKVVPAATLSTEQASVVDKADLPVKELAMVRAHAYRWPRYLPSRGALEAHSRRTSACDRHGICASTTPRAGPSLSTPSPALGRPR